jgi:muramoyltetrapeptide carboxypeptidase LdcA involved in peptidoglycan recycling
MKFATLPKLKPGDSVAIVSPSWVAPARFPHEYEFGLQRIRDTFQLNPVAMPNVANGSATNEQRISDLIEAFSDPEIKAVITTLGGSHQIEYIKHLPSEPFQDNPKPFFGYSDNSHFANFLFLNGIPSFYGGCVFTEFAMQGAMDTLTEKFLRIALFTGGEVKLEAAHEYNEEDLPWGVPENLAKRRRYRPNPGWFWDGASAGRGLGWGGCVESIDEILRHGGALPSLTQFEQIVLLLETSEECPSEAYVSRFMRALGERGILSRVQGLLVGRPRAWSFEKPCSDEDKDAYAAQQRRTVLEAFRRYNSSAPLVQGLDFGHTAPMICMPYGGAINIVPSSQTISAVF